MLGWSALVLVLWLHLALLWLGGARRVGMIIVRVGLIAVVHILRTGSALRTVDGMSIHGVGAVAVGIKGFVSSGGWPISMHAGV